MNVLKKIWKYRPSKIWLLVASTLLALILVASILLSTVFYNFIVIVAGRERYSYSGGSDKYKATFDSKDKATTNGDNVTYSTCLEGFVLLKNNNNTLPLLSNETKISVFGKNSVNIVYGGSGSSGGATEKAKTVEQSLSAVGITINPTLKRFYQDNQQSGEGRPANPSNLSGGDPVAMDKIYTGETPQSSYNDSVKSSYSQYSDAAIIILSRIGGEGFDLPREEVNGIAKHYLQLDQNEKDLINAVSNNRIFKKVIVLINTATTMELSEVNDNENVDAIMWIGMPGNNGIMALGDLLTGKVTPSGHTADIWASDFQKSPTWENFGGNILSDAYLENGKEQVYYYVDYEEGIYNGYRYYETAYAESQKGNYDGFDYDTAVVYPFGYGLSYAKFEWTLTNEDQINSMAVSKDTQMTFKVHIKNTSPTYSGREVVQLYITSPYTSGGIEKAEKVLVGFAKTDILKPNEEQDIEIKISSPYAYASYDYSDANKNGFSGYEVESGEYIFSISSDSHTAKITVSKRLDGFQYTTDPTNPTNTQIENLFDDADDELVTKLSRSDFIGTWPARRTDAERTKEKGYCKSIKSDFTSNNPNNYTQMPTMGAKNGISFLDMAGVPYDDERWEDFLDQLTFSELLSLYNDGAFQTRAITRLDVPATIVSDGTTGFVVFMGDPTIYETCVYCCQMVTASTWNIDRAYDVGVAEGEEGLVGNERVDGSYYTGLYAPGVNLHRSPFGGRNFEYYSEDSFLSGKMAASQINGGATKGIYYDMKHFALNDQETHRDEYGVTTWATEQTIREIYLKAFEIAVKDSVTVNEDGVTVHNAKGIMSSFNRIGNVWAGGDYRLLTTVLRDEWNFRGVVISDFNTHNHMDCQQMAYAGGDLNLQTLKTWSAKENAANATVLRNGAKNILYVVANSNAMRGKFTISLPTWQVCMIIIDIALFLGLAIWGVFVVLKAFKTSQFNSTSSDITTE